MKAFFWKQFIKDPAKPEHKEIIWAKVDQHEISDEFMADVVEAFHDKRAQPSAKPDSGGQEVIKVVGPTKKEFFSPGESRAIQMSMPKFPKAEPLK